MKTVQSIALLAGMALLGFNVSAQTTDPEQTAQKETNWIKANVTGITSDEENQIAQVELEHAKSMRDAHNTITDKNAMKTQKKQLCDSRDAKIKAILTADQYTQYLKMEKDKKKKA